MAVPPLCVRVSLFQAVAAANSNPYDAVRSPQQGDRLFRCQVERYRGDVLIPLAALPLSPLSVEGEDEQRHAHPTAASLIAGLEQRLSRYCVLHVPPTQTKQLLKSSGMSASSLSAFPAKERSAARVSPGAPASERDLEDSASLHRTLVCANCSSHTLAEAAQASTAATAAEKAPWIVICQLQRIPSGPSDVDEARGCISIEDWMLRMHGPEECYVTQEEAAALRMGTVDAASRVAGGECYAAFFQLTMIAAEERAVRLGQGLGDPSHGAPHTSASSVSATAPFFTVTARRHVVRLGLPSTAGSSSSSSAAPSATSLLNAAQTLPTLSPAAPTLKAVVLNRLQTQRGVTVRRLVDAQSGAAVLPCESASTLLAASVSRLTAECAVQPLQEPDEAPTQPLHSPAVDATQRLDRLADGRPRAPASSPAQATDELFHHLVGLRAERHAARQDYYYYANGAGWAEEGTAISLSELPSESELRMTSVASGDSHCTAIYPHSASSPRPSLTATRTSTSVVNVSGENSRSNPVTALPPTGSSSSSSNSDGGSRSSENGSEARSQQHGTDGVVSVKPNSIDYGTASAEAFVASLTFRHSALSSPSPGKSSLRGSISPLARDSSCLSGLRDSLLELNEVFVYEDEETVPLAQSSDDATGGVAVASTLAVDGAAAQGGGGVCQAAASPAKQRTSSLVWSTPAARGSGGAFVLSDSGVCPTPLTYRTSTQLSISPSTSPLAEQAELKDRAGDAHRTQQRLDFGMASSSASASQSSEKGEEEAEKVEGGVAASKRSSLSTESVVEAEKNVANTSEKEQCSATGSESHSERSVGGKRPAVNAGAAGGGVAAGCGVDEEQRKGGHWVPSRVDKQTRESSPTSTPQRTLSVHHNGDEEGHFTPLRYAASSLSGGGNIACTPPSSPSPKASSGGYGAPFARAAHQLDERTTPLPSSSTPPSRSRTSEVALRSQLQTLNPLATQGEGKDEGVSRDMPVFGPVSAASQGQQSRKRSRDEASTNSRDGDEHSPVSAPVQASARAWAVPPSVSSSPRAAAAGSTTAATPLFSPLAAYADSARSSSARLSSLLPSLPSTVAAKRPEGRHRSPIYFSPEELADMASDAQSNAGSSSVSSGIALSADDLTQDGDTERKERRRRGKAARTEGAEVAPWEGRYGPFVASYPLQGSDEDDDEDDDDEGEEDDSAPWNHPSTPTTTAPPPQPSSMMDARYSTPQRSLVSAGFVFAPFASGLVSTALGSLSEQARRQHPISVQPQLGGVDVLSSAPRVTSQRLRRSESHSASGMEAWVRFSDVDTEEGSNMGVAGRVVLSADEEDGMLVTQQEIPDFAAEMESSSSSESDEEYTETDEEMDS